MKGPIFFIGCFEITSENRFWMNNRSVSMAIRRKVRENVVYIPRQFDRSNLSMIFEKFHTGIIVFNSVTLSAYKFSY